MKILNSILFFAVTVMIFSCSSSKRVITQDGTIYNVNGDKITKNGTEINDSLSASEKENIYELVEKEEALEEQQEKRINDLEKAISEQEQIEKNAKERQRELKDQLDDFKAQINKRQDLRDEYVKVKKNYNDKTREFERLKKKGNLSSTELKEWEAKLKTLEAEVAKAKLELEGSAN